MSNSVRHLYEFGQFQLDVANSRLLRDGQVVPLKPKVFDTLVALVENRGSVISKNELMERLWPETIVEENNLTQNISALRKVFAGSSHAYIETVPKRGYRFVAEVREVCDEDETLIIQRHTSTQIIIEQEESDTSPQQSTTADASLSTVSSSVLTRKKLIASAAVILLIALSVIIWTVSRPSQKFNLSDFRFTRLADWKSEPGETGASAVFAPDGKMIAYARMKNGQRDLWVQQVSGSDPNPVTNDHWDNHSPVWSPDSLELAFLSNRGKPGIYRVPFLGGPPTLIKELEEDCTRLIAWFPEAIYYEFRGNLFALNLTSLSATRVIELPPYPYVRFISLSPDRKRIVYKERDDQQEKVFIRDLSGGPPVQLQENEEDKLEPVWMPDGSGILYSAKRNGFYHICVTYLSGTTQQLTSGDRDFIISDISSDGSMILYTTSIEESDLCRAGVDERRDEHLTFDIKAELWPAVSPDNRQFAFQQIENLSKFFDCSIWLAPTDNSADPRLIIRNGFYAMWSPDGSKISFLRYKDEAINLWIAESVGSDEKRVSTDGVLLQGITGMPYNRYQIRDYVWSPDGKHLAYISKKLGNWNLCVFSIDSWKEINITNSTDNDLHFRSPIWSLEGRRLAYVSQQRLSVNQSKYFIHVVEGKSENVVFESDSDICLLGWSHSGSDLVTAIAEPLQAGESASTGLRTVGIFQVISGEKHKLAELKETYYKNIQLSPDRQAIAFASRQDGRDNLWVLPFGKQQRKISDNTDPNIYFSSLEWSPDGKTIYYGRQQRKNQISFIEAFR